MKFPKNYEKNNPKTSKCDKGYIDAPRKCNFIGSRLVKVFQCDTNSKLPLHRKYYSNFAIDF